MARSFPTPMTLAPGTRLGPYDVEAAIGSGGMGEVYRARDSRLHRHVAIKVLPAALATDVDRVARFEREAQTLAALNHPHIAAIHGLEETGAGGRALVMELVDGETLAERLARGPLPTDEAIGIARQIAEALQAAHEQGIVHRDLKPANVKVRPDGTVKVLDFGLAKLTMAAEAAAPANLTLSPTLTSPAGMTAVGMLLGTAAYMSPEQARGKAVDRRADVWALGCVVYEMLTGRPAFEGEDVTQIIAAVVRGEPDWSRLPSDLPPTGTLYLRRSLEKDVRRRVQDAGDFRLALEGVFDVPEESGVRRSRWRIGAIGAAVASIVAAALGFVAGRPALEPQPAGVVRFETTVAPYTGGAAPIAITPDGQTIAFTGQGPSGVRTLWLRALDVPEPKELPQGRGIGSMAWSPDNSRVAFLTDTGALQTIDVSSGTVQTLQRRVAGFQSAGLAWVGTEIVVPARGPEGTHLLLAYPVSGGNPRRVIAAKNQVLGYPDGDPAGEAIIYRAEHQDGTAQVCSASLSGEPRGCAAFDGTTLAYAGDDTVLFASGGTIFAQRFDVTRGVLEGERVAVAEDVAGNALGRHWFAVGRGVGADLLAYLPAGAAGNSQFAWLDRAGRERVNIGEAARYDAFDLSPDGRYVAVTRGERSGRALYMLDVARGAATRVQTPPIASSDVIWAPDARRVVFRSTDGIIEQPAFGGAMRLLFKHPAIGGLEHWSLDGRYIAALVRDGEERQATLLPAAGGSPLVVTRGTALIDEYRFSPDGSWLAYNSDESGRQEVYVTALPPTGERWQVSTSGGVQPRWSVKTGLLYYLAIDGTVSEVGISGGRPPNITAPRALFTIGFPPSYNVDHFDVAPDGQRFLVKLPVASQQRTPLNAIVNWRALLPR